MARATTAAFAQFVLEVETTTPGTYARICGLTDVQFNRAAQIDTAEVPDCDDESLPYSMEKEVRSLDFSVSATGVWAQESHELMLDWFYTSTAKNARIGHLNADVGDTQYEQGSVLLANLGHARTKGQKVSAAVELQFSGTPTRVPMET